MKLFGYKVTVSVRKIDDKKDVKDAISARLKVNQEDGDRLIPIIRAIRQIGYMFPEEFSETQEGETNLVSLKTAKKWAEDNYPDVPRIGS